MFSAGISADLEFRVDRSKRYNFYRDRRKQGDFAETVENATKQGDRINPDVWARGAPRNLSSLEEIFLFFSVGFSR